MIDKVGSLFPELAERVKGWQSRHPRMRWLLLIGVLLVGLLSVAVESGFSIILENLPCSKWKDQALLWLRAPRQVRNWVLFVVFPSAAVVLVSLTAILLDVRSRRKVSRAPSATGSDLEFLQWFDDRMMPVLSKAVVEAEGDIGLPGRFAWTCLAFVTENLWFVSNAAILRRETDDSDWLTEWEGFNRYGGIREATRLYIGDYRDNAVREDLEIQRGVRGRVFVTGESRVVNISSRQEWAADDADFRPPQVNVPCPYDSFLAVRMSVRGDPFGVLFIEVDSSAEMGAWRRRFFELIGCRIAWMIHLLESSSKQRARFERCVRTSGEERQDRTHDEDD